MQRTGLIGVVMVVALGLSGAAHAERGPFPFVGEEIHYSISMFGGEAARAALSVGRPFRDANLGRVVPVHGIMMTVGLASALVSFKYESETYFDAATWQAVWSLKLLEDRGRSRTYETYYDRDAWTAHTIRVEPARDINRQTDSPIPSHVHDALSWIYDVRTQPLEIGDEYHYFVFDGWKMRRLRLRVAVHIDRPFGNEEVRAAELIVHGDTLEPYVAVPWGRRRMTHAPSYAVSGSERLGRTWVTLDDRRIPLGLEIRTAFGFMRINADRHVPPRR